MKQVIICNSPAQTGKDEFSKYLNANYGHNHLEFKEKLINLTLSIYDVSREVWDSIYISVVKDQPNELFNGLSPRQALIYVSEEVIKPKFGKSYFGIAAAKKLKDGLNVYSDGGFFEEIVEVADAVGLPQVLLFEFKRASKTFSGDSRGVVCLGDSKRVIFDNNGPLEDLYTFADAIHELYSNGELNYENAQAAADSIVNKRTT